LAFPASIRLPWASGWDSQIGNPHVIGRPRSGWFSSSGLLSGHSTAGRRLRCLKSSDTLTRRVIGEAELKESILKPHGNRIDAESQ